MAQPVPPGSPEVASALLAFSSGTDVAQAAARLYRALLGAKLLVATTGGGAEDEESLEVGLVASRGPAGRPRLLVYTGERSFALGSQPPPFAVARATGLFSFALRHGVDQMSIDSGGPVSAALERWELEALAERRIPQTPRRRLSMVPADPESIRAVLGALTEVFPAGSVFVLEENGARPRRLLLGTVGPPPVGPAELEALLTPCLAGGEGVSLLRLSPGDESELRQAGIEPLPGADTVTP